MIITCPNCQTSYQVAEKAIGSAGRKVQCAHCHESWQAVPEPEPPASDDDRIFDEKAEAALDAAFKQEEERVHGTGDRPDPMEDKLDADAKAESDDSDEAASAGAARESAKRRDGLIRRRLAMARGMPIGKLRANARFAAACGLVALIGCGIAFRTEIVRIFPDLAGFYEMARLNVNVVGLEFRDVETLRAFKNGAEALTVSGRIQNISDRRVTVPAAVVSILDEAGTSVYSWRVTPDTPALVPGQIAEFESRVNAAPQNAHTVRLEFASGRPK